MKEFEQLISCILKMVDFSPDDISLFTRNMLLRQCRKGSYLLEESKIASAIFFINKGITRNLSILPDGTEFTQYFSLENTFITEYASFLNRAPAIYSIQCIENCEIVEIPKMSIEQGYIHIREGNKLGRLIAENYFTQFVKNAYERQTKTLMQQYETLDVYFPGIHRRVPQHMIASYLGITPVHLSRLKSKSRR